MSTYYAILTAVGEAKLANATALGTKLQLSAMAVGDGNGALPTPVRTQTALVRETYRAELNNLSVDPLNASQIIAELVIPETEGGYWLREMGIYDATGDLFAVANCPPSYKPQMAEGSGRTQVLRMVLIVSSTAAVQLKIDPSIVLATRAFAESLITVHMGAADPHKQYQLRGGFTNLNVNTQLSAAHEGVLLLSAEQAARTYLLPSATAALGVREFVLRRTDISTNALVVAAFGDDKIMLDTTAAAEGQASTELLFAGDYLRLRSDGAGKWWCVGQAQLPARLASGRTIYSTPGNSTYAVPPVLRSGRVLAKVKVTGGGGGGARWSSSPGPSGGAGAGVAEKLINLSGVPSVPVVVASGGLGATANGFSGTPGGTSSFGEHCSAPGGGGGQASANSAAGAVGVGGDLNYSIGASSPAVAGPTGAIYGGAGGGNVSSFAASDTAIPKRAGHGGAGRSASVAPNGADGEVEISWG